jgi:DNA-binding MarR family transcriptional regulator
VGCGCGYKLACPEIHRPAVKLLCSKVKSATELLGKTGISKADLSQHMAVLVGKGAVNSSGRNGVKIY